MKKLLDSFLNIFNTTEEEAFYYVKIERNEKCYCDSGKNTNHAIIQNIIKKVDLRFVK